MNIYAACDGIDASYNAQISGDAVVNIYTDKYSEYSEEVTATSESVIYVGSTSASYKYSIYFYNTDGSYVWKNSSGTAKTMSVRSGRSSYTYYLYEVEKPSGYTSMIVYLYSSSQEQGQSTSYTRKSSNMTINANYDTILCTGSSFSWTNYTTQSAGGFGPGGMSQGNSDKGDYSTKGIKADNEILISGGTIFVKSYDDALHTNSDVTLGDEDDTTDDYLGTGIIRISGGSLTIYSNDDGIHADTDLYITDEAYINVTSAYEGIEANRIFVTGGETHVYATDDAMNAATCNGKYSPLVSISGGVVDLATPSGDTDTLDSNGNVTVSGGVLILKNGQSSATSMTGGTIDLDGTLTISGGMILSVGTWCSEARMTANVTDTSTSLSAGEYTLKDASGNTVASFTLTFTARGYRIAIAEKSGTYSLYRGSTLIKSF